MLFAERCTQWEEHGTCHPGAVWHSPAAISSQSCNRRKTASSAHLRPARQNRDGSQCPCGSREYLFHRETPFPAKNRPECSPVGILGASGPFLSAAKFGTLADGSPGKLPNRHTRREC